MQAKTKYTPDKLLRIAVDAAAEATRHIRSAMGSGGTLVWEIKGESDFVTGVDRGAESAIVRIVRSRCPEANIIGEELSPAGTIGGAGISFIVDPLDGTTNFLHGYPEFAVSICVTTGEDLVAAVVENAVNGETFTALANGGAFLNGEPISVSKETDPSRALIGTGFPFKRKDLLESYARQFVEVSRHTAGVRRAGSAALDLGNTACGRFDAFWELDLAPWDIAAGLLIVHEAGGVVTDVSGADKQIAHGAVVAGNPDIHRWLLKTIRDAGARDDDTHR